MLIVSGDKDILQLVSDRVKVLNALPFDEALSLYLAGATAS